MSKLEVLEVTSRESKKTIMLLHGYGANSQDLFPLHRFLDPAQNFHWYFPNGPLEIPIGFHMVGNAWFPIDIDAYENFVKTRNMDQLESRVPEHLIESRDAIVQFIQAKKIDVSKLILGGFSQGAMLAYHVSQALPEKVAGLILLSGAKIGASLLKNSMGPLKIFQSHGRMDPMLPFESGSSFNQFLKNSGHDVEFHEFYGGHEIPMDVLDLLHKWIEK